MLPSQSIDLIPLFAGEGDGVAVPGVVDVVHHALKRDVGDAEAHTSVEVSRLHGARSGSKTEARVLGRGKEEGKRESSKSSSRSERIITSGIPRSDDRSSDWRAWRDLGADCSGKHQP